MKNRFMHEQLSMNEGVPIIARYYDYERFTYPWHFHSEFEIIYVEESVGERFVADSMEPFCPGDVILLGNNVPHYLKSAPMYYDTNPLLRVKGVVIQFKQDFLSHGINNYTDLKHVKQLLSQSERGIHFPASDNQAMIEKINLLPTYKGINRIVHLLLLLDEMAKAGNRRLLGTAQFNNSLSLFTDNRLEKVLSYVTFHYTETINLDKIAAMVPMNTTSFCRYFKEKSGKTFTEYVLELRIGYACKLLVGNLMDISQISIECGFNTMTHFNRIFKRNTGLTPSEYRKQFLK